LALGLAQEQRAQLNQLLTIPEGSRYSQLDQLRSGPARISGPALRVAISRLQSVRALGITLPAAARIPLGKIAALARFANRAKAQAIGRMPAARAAAFDWLRGNLHRGKPTEKAPREIIGLAWQRHVLREDGGVDLRAYTFCLLDQLKTALRRRDVFAKPSWRYADPRENLLAGPEWEAMRPMLLN
jgi:hypothetical protein